MKAIVFHGESKLEITQVEDPTPSPQEVVVKIHASGMCGSDLHTYHGPLLETPVVGGHEPSGVVVEVGSAVSRHWIGQPVMIHHYIGCQQCDQCRSGWTQMCRSGAKAMGATAPGAHAEYLCVPVSTIMPMPSGLTFAAASAVSCGTGTAWSALERLNLRGNDSIAIFGQGPVGLAATQLASSMGARVIALDISPSRLERSASFGAAACLNPAEIDSVPDAIKELNGGFGVSKSLETSGSSVAATSVLDVLDLWGTACWVGVGSTINFELQNHLYRQISAVTSWTMSIAGMMECANHIVSRGIDVDALYTETWSLDQGQGAYDLFEKQTSGKGLFIPSGTMNK